MTATLPEVPSGNFDASSTSALPPMTPKVALNAVELNTLAALPLGVVIDRVSEPIRSVQMVTPRTEIAAYSLGTATIEPRLIAFEPLAARMTSPDRSRNRQQAKRRGPKEPKVVASNDDLGPAVAPVALKPQTMAVRPLIWCIGPNAYNSPRSGFRLFLPYRAKVSIAPGSLDNGGDVWSMFV